MFALEKSVLQCSKCHGIFKNIARALLLLAVQPDNPDNIRSHLQQILSGKLVLQIVKKRSARGIRLAAFQDTVKQTVLLIPLRGPHSPTELEHGRRHAPSVSYLPSSHCVLVWGKGSHRRRPRHPNEHCQQRSGHGSGSMKATLAEPQIRCQVFSCFLLDWWWTASGPFITFPWTPATLHIKEDPLTGVVEDVFCGLHCKPERQFRSYEKEFFFFVFLKKPEREWESGCYQSINRQTLLS